MVIAIAAAYEAFNACQLSEAEWLICIIIALSNFPIVFVFRLIYNTITLSEKKKHSKVMHQGYDLMEEGRQRSLRDISDKNLNGGFLKGESTRSSVVEVIRKIKIDHPLPLKRSSIDSLKGLITDRA